MQQIVQSSVSHVNRCRFCNLTRKRTLSPSVESPPVVARHYRINASSLAALQARSPYALKPYTHRPCTLARDDQRVEIAASVISSIILNMPQTPYSHVKHPI